MIKYKEYKPSNVDFIGDIPEGWEARKLKYLANIMGSNVDKLTKENEIPVLLCNYTDVYKNNSITNDIEFMKATATNLEIEKFLIQKDDVIITKDSETADDMAMPTYIAEDFDNVLCGYHLSLIRTYKELNGKFLYYLFTEKDFNIRFEVHSNGVTRFGLGAGIIKNTFICYPPLKEQIKIANFLDTKNRQIEEFIKDKETQIALLQEQKEAIINRAVTKGLDDSVEFKDSGIEWIGDIPKSWEVKKLKYLADIMASNVDKLTKENETPVLLCNYTDVYKNDYITNDIDFMEATATDLEIKKFLIKKDDVIITKDSETADDMAMPTYITKNFDNVLCGYHLSLIRTYVELKGKFLYYLFTARDFNIRFEVHSNGVTRFGLGSGIIKNTFIGFPSINDQKQIIKYIEIQTTKIDKLINQTHKSNSKRV